MIKIQEHLNNIHSDLFLQTLAVSHWKNLNPKLKGKDEYKQNSLIEKCKQQYNRCLTQNYIDTYANKNTATAIRHRKFFKYLIKHKYNNLKKIIISNPNDLEIIKQEVLQILKCGDYFDNSGNKPKLTKFGELLTEKIFNYKAFRQSNFCKELFLKLDFMNTTCPYCNDNKLKIIHLNSHSSKKTLYKAYLDLDHFFTKLHNPFFALSFFNLIPSCHDCNSSDKGDKEFSLNTHIHPYLESFDDYYLFKISLTKFLGDKIDKINIINKVMRVNDETLKDILLENRYDNNFELAENLIKLYMNNKHHIGTSFESSFKELILRDIPIEKKNILRYERAKLNRDILKQVDIFSILGIN